MQAGEAQVAALGKLVEVRGKGEADAVVGDAQPHGVLVALQRDRDLARPAMSAVWISP